MINIMQEHHREQDGEVINYFSTLSLPQRWMFLHTIVAFAHLRDWASILGLEAFINFIKQYTKLFEVTVSDAMTIEGLYAYYVKG